MRIARAAAVALVVGLAASVLAACTGGSMSGTGIVYAWSGEPQNPLIPTDTSENTGGRVLDALFAGLVSYTADGSTENEVAESIATADAQHYTVTLAGGWTFTDRTPVTARSFVDAWNYGALSTNAQLQSSFFDPIEGYDEVAAANPAARTMSGLQVVDDRTFTITLKQPESAFPKRLGFAAYYPLPQSAYADMAAFGRHPIGNGPYRFANDDAWQHNVRIDLVTNPGYRGNRVARNEGVTFVLYSNLDTAYTDLLSNNLDVLDGVPASALDTYEDDLPGRTVNQPSATIETFTIPERLPHFGGAEGVLRRQAISQAIDRGRITDRLMAGTRTPARDFTSPAVEGWTPDLPGSEHLDFAPDRTRALWAQA
ncbi:MAG: ABC transporter substrate-binding protein, partial [Nocardiaceae bacterium]|nr:ABC transporter substrate-binding protein [Nocardiaceae bacterium]